MFNFEVIGYVVTEVVDPTLAHDEIEKLKDFDAEIFDRFKNIYSEIND
jgi:mannitol-1-phosphate/altronate dehydrogenase